MRIWIVICAFILAGTLTAQNKINRYEYWFDNNFAGRTTSIVSPIENFTLNTSVPAAALLPGLHVIHFRFRDDNNAWSSCVSQFFFRTPPVTASVSITGYEYWFDNNYAGRIFSGIAAQQSVTVNTTLNASALVQGLHTVHVRFIDSEGTWSSPLSQFFFRSPSSTSTAQEINAYQYWFDNNYAAAITTSAGPAQNITLITTLNASSLTNGLHTVHLRFRDNSGDWSSVLSQFFFRNAATSSTAIDTYQYWFDNNFTTQVTQTVAPQQNFTINTNLATPTLPTGLHAVHLRFRDSTGKWSSVISQFFHVNEVLTGTNMITEYRYWFDENDSAMVQTQITAAQNATINTSISMITIPQGVHVVHFQFMDSLGKWSSATTDTIQKLALPIAMFDANDTVFCDSGTVAFMDHSIDADQFLWYFGDGDSSTVQHPNHQYTQPGLYTVQLAISDSASGADTSVIRTQYIRVYGTPSFALTVASNDSICNGQTVTITADSSAIYAWNTGDTMQAITTNTGGDYWAIVSNMQHPACSTVTDTINITVMPLPVVDLGADTGICENTQLTLDVTASGTTYLWSTGNTTPNITVNNPGSYWVSVTSSFGCQDADTIMVNIDSLPIASFSFAAAGNSVSFTDLSSYSTNWFWDFGDGNFSSQPNPVHNYSATGTYTVTLIVSNACDSDTITDIVLITGMESITTTGNQVILYPNPANETVNISYTASAAENVIIDIMNMNGELVAPVLSAAVVPGAVFTATLNVDHLADGVYIVRITNGPEKVSTRLVIAK